MFATVKGDVHDIGKNICSIVLSCNGYDVIDLGVMVAPETIVETVKKEYPDILCLSGLITPSLAEMVNVARMLREAGETLPILVGGATTSRLHTALKIAGEYDGPVVHVTDASQNPLVAAKLLDPVSSDSFVKTTRDEYRKLATEYASGRKSMVSLAEARKNGENNRLNGVSERPVATLGEPIIEDIKVGDLIPLINWKMLFHAWRLTGKYLENFPYDLCDGCMAKWQAYISTLSEDEKKKGEEALHLYRDALQILQELKAGDKPVAKGVVAFFEAHSEGDDLIIDETVRLPLLRQQTEGSRFLSLSDYVARKGEGPDYIGVFAVTADAGKTDEENDDYKRLLLQTLSDRLAEAASEWLHDKVRRELWGYAPESKCSEELLKGDYRGIRPAMGYPMLPDQLLNHNLSRLLPLDKLGISLTENGAMTPSSTVSGLYIAHDEAEYFMIGEIGEDQIEDYASRRGLTPERIKEILRQ